MENRKINTLKYLKSLTESILALSNSQPISKIRLTRYVYFCHRELLRLKVKDVKSENLLFKRMPLGPSPINFELIFSNPKILVVSNFTDSGLTYDKYAFSLRDTNSIDIIHSNVLRSLTSQLDLYDTYTIVNLAQKNSTWKNQKNDDIFELKPNDYKQQLEFQKKPRLSKSHNNQKIQALLLKGMMDEIILDNTGLEYPQLNEIHLQE